MKTQKEMAIAASYREDQEVIELVCYLLTLYVPDSLDRRRVLDRLRQGDLFFIRAQGHCPKCQGELICPNCADVEADVSATITIGGRTIHV